ncbi:MAG: DUF6918 family protein [Myxococcota bacterium]
MSNDLLSHRILEDAKKRPAILNDCERVIEEEVGAKSGLSGMAIKAGYLVVCKIKPGIIRESMDGLLDDFVRRIDPFWQEHRSAGGSPEAFPGYMNGKSAQIADALLGITDDRARRANNKTLVSAYEKLRPQGKKLVADAIPRVSAMLGKHL